MSTLRANPSIPPKNGDPLTPEQVIEMLRTAYWMEIETVISYLAAPVNPDGLRAEQISRALGAEVQDELGHAMRFAQRIKELGGVVPGSMQFTATQTYLQPPEIQTDIAHIVRGVIEAERGAIEHYTRIAHATDGTDPVTNDMIVTILADEERHRRLFEGYLRDV